MSIELGWVWSKVHWMGAIVDKGAIYLKFHMCSPNRFTENLINTLQCRVFSDYLCNVYSQKEGVGDAVDDKNSRIYLSN